MIYNPDFLCYNKREIVFMRRTMKKGISIIGSGAIARLHAQAIAGLENARLVGVCGSSFKKSQIFAKEFACKAYRGVEELLLDEETEIVSICTPSGSHAEFAVLAANAKKHLLIEKPLAITKVQLEEIKRAVEQNGVKVQVVAQLRFTPSIQKLKKAIDEGRLGKILLADFIMKYYRAPEYYSESNWKGTWAMDGGGALMNQGVHGVDLLQYLVGGVKSVYAHCRTMAREIEVEDTANILLEYQNGAIGVIQATTVAYPGGPRTIKITGTNGTVVVEDDTIVRWDVTGEEGETTTSSSKFDSGANPMAFSDEYHRLQILDLLSTIETDGKALVDEKEGAKPVEIILAAYESERLGKKIELN